MTTLEGRPEGAAAQSPPAPAASREKYLDGLRAIAALHVAFSHTYMEIYPPEKNSAFGEETTASPAPAMFASS